ncbi:hypothetical protein CVT25_007678 [Psilocybe cyanescens]|uniref:Uncharacterized protein n=1 Tax=Psilocybe cyanescens TaxID=93625 RepID=A0A409XVK7_PSICY|nr:hypothetical protein CVT25_007678 [Psilocybe cyanescens]
MKNREKYKAVVDPEEMPLEIEITQFIRSTIGEYTFNCVRVESFKGDTGTTSNTHSNSHPYPTKISLIPLPSASLIAFPSPLLTRAHTVSRSSWTAMKTQKPSGIVTFAFRLAHAVSRCGYCEAGGGRVDVAGACKDEFFRCAREVLGGAV